MIVWFGTFGCAQGNAGGGLSPRKLRSMLRGVEKKRKEEECLDSLGFDMRSELNNADDAGKSSPPFLLQLVPGNF